MAETRRNKRKGKSMTRPDRILVESRRTPPRPCAAGHALAWRNRALAARPGDQLPIRTRSPTASAVQASLLRS